MICGLECCKYRLIEGKSYCIAGELREVAPWTECSIGVSTKSIRPGDLVEEVMLTVDGVIRGKIGIARQRRKGFWEVQEDDSWCNLFILDDYINLIEHRTEQAEILEPGLCGLECTRFSTWNRQTVCKRQGVEDYRAGDTIYPAHIGHECQYRCLKPEKLAENRETVSMEPVTLAIGPEKNCQWNIPDWYRSYPTGVCVKNYRTNEGVKCKGSTCTYSEARDVVHDGDMIRGIVAVGMQLSVYDGYVVGEERDYWLTEVVRINPEVTNHEPMVIGWRIDKESVHRITQLAPRATEGFRLREQRKARDKAPLLEEPAGEPTKAGPEQIKLIDTNGEDRGWYHLTGWIPPQTAPGVVQMYEGMGNEVRSTEHGGAYEIKYSPRSEAEPESWGAFWFFWFE